MAKKQMTYQEFVDITCELGICGCGNPEDSYRAVHDLMLLVREIKEAPSKDLYNRYSTLTDNPYALTVLYMLNDREFLEHGTSVHGCWITPKGRKLTEALDLMAENEYDYDDTVRLLSEE